MIYTDLTKKALRFCYEAHKDQYDKGGVPYVFHSIHVAEQFDDELSVCVALMHDILEDTNYTIDDVEAIGFPKEVLEALLCITRSKQQDYMEYIRVVKTNALATKVKLADLQHNSDLTRLNEVDEGALRRIEKYKKAREILLGD